MDCCSTATSTSPTTRCPRCGGPSRKVTALTVASLARTTVQAADSWRYCGAPGCEVVWFSPTTSQEVTRAESRVRLFDKETAGDRPVCYCFGYSVVDVRAGLTTEGKNTVADAITARCRRGEDRCEETNPQGACCLGNVRRIRAEG